MGRLYVASVQDMNECTEQAGRMLPTWLEALRFVSSSVGVVNDGLRYLSSARVRMVRANRVGHSTFSANEMGKFSSAQ